MPPPVVKRAPRADAARNRERLIATALEMFAESGITVSVEEIVKRAEVGIGTLYRHFPTKDALIAAIVVERFDRMTAYAEGLSSATDAGAALATILEQLVIEGAAKKDFVEAIGGPDKLSAAGLDPVKTRFKAAIAVLVTRAQAAGAIRADVTATDVIALVRGISVAADGEQARMRHLAIILAGLRA
jgi:AcrR family transcriptional regulator